ncbi:MAG: hypothetical protein V4488_06010 [Pseudomonadota bacterium]
MGFPFLRSGQFHFRRLLQTRPRFVASLAIAVLAFLIVALAAAQVGYTRLSSEDALQLAIQQTKILKKKPPTASPQAQADLPRFDSAQLVDVLHQVADEVKLPVDEISYALEDNSNQAYLRYRVTLSVTASYPVIRKFADRFQGQAPHVSLDTISCAREAVTAAALSCDLGLSAFYQKAVHG